MRELYRLLMALQIWLEHRGGVARELPLSPQFREWVLVGDGWGVGEWRCRGVIGGLGEVLSFLREAGIVGVDAVGG